jgi:formate/nitrite transporter FocA (FNT family)
MRTSWNTSRRYSRCWRVVVFIANLLGAAVFSAVMVYGHVLEPAALQVLFEEVDHKAQ